MVTITTDTKFLRVHYSLSDSTRAMKDLLLKHIDETLVDSAMTMMGFKKVYDSPASMSHSLPGINLEVKHPVTGAEQVLHSIIMNLNDTHKWTREQIADWIENTFEIEQIAFKGVAGDSGKLAETTKVVVVKRLLQD